MADENARFRHLRLAAVAQTVRALVTIILKLRGSVQSYEEPMLVAGIENRFRRMV